MKARGGICTPKATGLDEKILDLIKENYSCIDNEFSCNAEVNRNSNDAREKSNGDISR